LHSSLPLHFSLLFFLNYTPTTAIYPLSLHDALPISLAPLIVSPLTVIVLPVPTFLSAKLPVALPVLSVTLSPLTTPTNAALPVRSEEHTSELQSLTNLVCRLLLEKKKQ